MRGAVREKLHHYIAEHGEAALQDPRSLRLYLLQEEGRFSQEIDGLLRVVEEKILPPFPGVEDREIYVQRIIQQIGVSREDALWFLESWEGLRSILDPLNAKDREGEVPLSEKEESFAAQALSASLREFLASPRSFKTQSLSSSMESFLRGQSQRREEAAMEEDPSLGEEKSLPFSEKKPSAEEELSPSPQVSSQGFQEASSEKELASSMPKGSGGGASFVPREEVVVPTPAFPEPLETLEGSNTPSIPPREELQQAPSVSGEDEQDYRWGAKEQYLWELARREGADPDYIGSRENTLLLEGAVQKKRNLRLAFVGLSGAILALLVAGLMWYNSPGNLLRHGRDALEKRAYAKSAVLFRKVLQKRPQDGEAYRLLGEALYFQGDYQESLKAFHHASRHVSPDVFLHNDMGYVYLSLERSEEALGAFEEALSLVPQYPQALKGLGLTYLHQGKDRLALEKMDEALSAIPEDGELLFALGSVNAKAGSFDRAESLFFRVLALDPGNESARLELEDLRHRAQAEGHDQIFAQHLDEGEGFLISGDAEAAARVYRSVLQKNAYSQEARTGLLDALLMLGLSEDAKSLVEETLGMAKAGTVSGDFAEYMEQNMASYEAKLAENRARQQGYDMAIAKASQMRERGEFEGAFAAYQGILEEEEYLPAYVGLGRTLAKQGKFAQSLEAYERAQALGRSFRGGAPGVDEEIKALKVLLKKDDLEKEIEEIYRRALGLERKGMVKQAEKLYREVLARKPSHELASKGLRRLSRTASPPSGKERPSSLPGTSNPKDSQEKIPEPINEAPPAWLVLPNGDPVISEEK